MKRYFNKCPASKEGIQGHCFRNREVALKLIWKAEVYWARLGRDARYL